MKFLLIFLALVALNSEMSEGVTPPLSQVGRITLSIPCGTTPSIANQLHQNYREKVIFKGLSRNGLMKFYANSGSSTFTVVLESGGVTCVVVAGNYLIKETSGVPL